MSAGAAVAAPLRSGSWAQGAPASGPAPDACAGMPGIVGWALEYVQPLQQWLDELTGDPWAVAGAASTWVGMEAALETVATDLRRAQAQIGELDGATARVLLVRYDDLMPVVEDAAAWSGAVASAARLASTISEAVRGFVCDFLAQLADFIDALFGFTLNPFDKIEELRELADAAGRLVTAGWALLQQMFTAFQQFVQLLADLGPVISEYLTRLREAIAEMLPFVGAVAGVLAGGVPGGGIGLVVGGAAGDMLMDAGKVRRYSDEDLQATLDQIRANDPGDPALDTLDRLDGLSSLVAANGLTDAMGGKDSTAIDVKLVRAADGSEHWVVSLPSTQEWLDSTGNGAMNDRNTNVELMLMDNPALKSQYERAVLRAMRESGMAPGDPVVFTGFSQGGIMAANLAADPALPYQPIGVVTNGSPVDSFVVPQDVPVIAFQHASDPVPALDTNADGQTPPNVHRVVLDNPGGSLLPGDTHNNANYAQSIASDPSAQRLSEQYAFLGGEVIDHQVFEGVQR